MPLVLTRLTEAAPNGVGVAQGVVVQASTTPLTVYPVTTKVTGNVCGLTAAPPVPLAVMVRMPLYVPGVSAADGLTLTLKLLPVPLSLPEVDEIASQEALLLSPVTAQETGYAQLPVALSAMVCDGGVAPCAIVKETLVAGMVCSVQGCATVSVTAMLCGLPCAGVLVASLADTEISVL